MAALRAARPAAETTWNTHPIGGEIRPEAWGQVFDELPADPRIQNFRKCVEATHVTWLMDSGMFKTKQDAARITRAGQEVRRMGYEFHVPAVSVGEVKGSRLSVSLELENRGVAPFYYEWKPEYGFLDNGAPVKTLAGSGTLTGLLPGEEPRVWTDLLDLAGIKPGTYTLALRMPNPMKGGTPIRFANATQDIAGGWLSLGDILIP